MKSTLLCLTILLFAMLSPLSAGNLPDSLDDEQVLKQHFMKMSRYPTLLATQQPTTNQNDYDVTYYDLNLRIVPRLYEATVYGNALVAGKALAPLSKVELDLSAWLDVDSVTSGSISLPFVIDSELVVVDIADIAQDQVFAFRIHYHGVPVSGGFSSFNVTTVNGLPMIATLSEPYYARTWWPCKDHPTDKADSVDIRVTIDNRVLVASNGSLVGITENGDGTNTTHWHESYPIATYLVSLAIADYDHYSQTFSWNGHQMPVDFYIFRGLVENYRANNDKVVEMLGFFSETFGEYPFIREKYGHAQFTWGGGMEHQTCSSMGAFSEWIIAHELAHQWWGDMITCGTWHDIWLNEGFARYSEALWTEHKSGFDGLKAYMGNLYSLDRQVYVDDTTDVQEIFHPVVYNKGAYVLHTLRYIIGDDTFFELLRTYGESAYKYGTATTEDFKNIAEQISGIQLDKFFEQWVYQPQMPDYHFGYYALETDTGWVTSLLLEQVQDRYPLFETDIDIEFQFTSGADTIRLHNDRRKQSYRFVFDEQPLAANLDPSNWLANQWTQIQLSFQLGVDTLQFARIGIPFSVQLDAIAGLPPFQWQAAPESLPEGFALTPGGLLSGTASDTGTYVVPITITDTSNPPQQVTVNLVLLVPRGVGDVDLLAGITLSDLLFLLRYLYFEGPAPLDHYAADVNCDGRFDVIDIVAVLNYLYEQAPLPCPDS